MTHNWQTYVAPLVVLLATAYLIWGSRRRKGSAGCASGGSCACPQPKLKVPPHLKTR